MIKVYFFLLLIFLAFRIIPHNLPNNITENKIKKFDELYNSIELKGYIFPPSITVREAAKWKEFQAITITWTSNTSILNEIVRTAKTV